MIKVLLVQEHELVRLGLKYIISAVHGMQVIAEASSGEQAAKQLRNVQANVCVIDGQLSGIGSLETVRRMLHVDRDCKIIVLAGHSDDLAAARFLKAGVVGFLLKHCGEEEFINTIRKVNVGQRYIAADVAQRLALQTSNAERSPIEALTDRELQILTLITHGLSVTKIADMLCLSSKTVNSHRYRIFNKLGLENDVELTHFAIRYNLLADLNMGMVNSQVPCNEPAN